jgi:hypothetical protein
LTEKGWSGRLAGLQEEGERGRGSGKKVARMSERAGEEVDGEQSEPSVMSTLLKRFFNTTA